jgi:GNAT superfamily N-acetyltransferase
MREQAQIRGFKPDDYDEVMALWRESGLTLKRSDTLQELKKLLVFPGSVFLIVEADRGDTPSEIMGTVIGAWDGRRAWLYHLALKRVARRHRIGSRLMSTAEQRLRDSGATKDQPAC